MPQIGEKISFIPSAFINGANLDKPLAGMRGKVKATIDYINEEHHWFRAAYDLFGQTMHECFKF